MFNKCKLCGNYLLYERRIDPVGDLKEAFRYKCLLCPNYYLLMSFDKMTIESEVITSANYCLVYFPRSKSANVIQKESNNMGWKSIHKLNDINELTHELAVQWVNKLKTYVLFQ